MPARPSSRSESSSRLFAILVATCALVLAALGCSSKADSALPTNPATPGAFVAARESATGRYRIYRVLAANPLPAGTSLHLVAYDETTADFDEARRLTREAALHPIHENVVVLERDFVKREHQVIGFRPVSKGERANPTSKTSE